MEQSKHDRILEEVKLTMQSLDQLERVAANPYLYTRISARLEEPSRPSRLATPLWQLGLVAVLFILNFLVINGQIENNRATQRSASIETMSSTYSLDQGSGADPVYYNFY
ncbi:MAG: hypothetical protein AAFP19_01270 [Bacteroidota bacterium]